MYIHAALSQHDFLPVRSPAGDLAYGGDQEWYSQTIRVLGPYLARTACGPTAAANILLYLNRRDMPVELAEYLACVRRVLRRSASPIIFARTFAHAVKRVSRGHSALTSAEILCNRRTPLSEALSRVSESLERDVPVAMQVLRNDCSKAPGEARVYAWHWVTLTALDFDPELPERAVYTCSTWGERRTGLFSNAWADGRGIFKRTSLVILHR